MEVMPLDMLAVCALPHITEVGTSIQAGLKVKLEELDETTSQIEPLVYLMEGRVEATVHSDIITPHPQEETIDMVETG